jgi:hypothetical protein
VLEQGSREKIHGMPCLSKRCLFTSTWDARLADEQFQTTASLVVASVSLRRKQKKADMAEHPEAFGHVGLLVNEPPGTAGLLFI